MNTEDDKTSGVVNKVILIGHVVNEPDVRYISKTDDHLAQFGLETEPSVIHQLVCRGAQALYCKDLVKKGTRLYIEGHLQYVEQRHPQLKDFQWQNAQVRILSLQLIDAPERLVYPEDIKRIDFRRKK
ncbi:hypothetical protein A9Q81_27790 [Gammaproteobacteria bacterium 42_54_T18]|nr:hypothetical protein A9Q81_27790 [Gammaproteobacteria bacterium 42_54_T18]